MQLLGFIDSNLRFDKSPIIIQHLNGATPLKFNACPSAGYQKKKLMKKLTTIICLMFMLVSNAQMQQLKVSSNKRFFIKVDGKPFFWLGDTGWLLFVKCTREDALEYLD